MVGPEDLDLLPTDALIVALARRFDAVVFGGLKHLGGGQINYCVRHGGDRFLAIGLAFHAAADLSTTTMQTERPPHDG